MQRNKEKHKTDLNQIMAEFPRKHLVIAGTAIAVIFFSLLFIPGHSAQAKRTAVPLSINLSAISAKQEAAQPTQKLAWKEVEVQKGDNLSKLFQRVSLGATDVYDIVSNSTASKDLLRLYPGQKLAFQINDNGKLEALKYVRNRLESTLYQREEGVFTTTEIRRDPEIRQNYSSSTISSSLYNAAQKSGLPQNLIMELANIFGGVIDFVYDVRSGDNFTILYQERFLDGEKLENGPIQAAQFTNRGKTFTAYRYVYPDGTVGYFNEDGVSMRKAFLRAPLDFSRISSSFNLRRLHPIFKTARPHRGIDYAASTGTPVYAAGDGRVLKSGYTKANGNYVVISHGSKYTTKYLHLNKRAVRRGQKVKQRKIIGWVGSTGYATGPHLHYEFLVNGVNRNPRTILQKLPKAKSVEEKEKNRFLAQIGGLQLQMAAYKSHSTIAAAQLSDNATL
jgi:murein DD-endopeptidase MepM/ murein hydrolase activator NlpD